MAAANAPPHICASAKTPPRIHTSQGPAQNPPRPDLARMELHLPVKVKVRSPLQNRMTEVFNCLTVMSDVSKDIKDGDCQLVGLRS